jgi:hypothetical protein
MYGMYRRKKPLTLSCLQKQLEPVFYVGNVWCRIVDYPNPRILDPIQKKHKNEGITGSKPENGHFIVKS